MLADSERIQSVAHPRICERQCQPDQLGVGEQTSPANLLGAGESIFDVASSLRIGTMAVDRAGLIDQLCQHGAALGVDGSYGCDEFGAPRVQTPAVQYRCRGDGRRRGVLDRSRTAASVCAVPPTASRDPVDHVHGEQADIPPRKLVVQLARQVTVLVGARLARGALVVDDHRNGNLCSGGGGQFRKAAQRAATFATGEIGTQDSAHFTLGGGHEYQRFFGHEAQNGGQCRDQYAGAIERCFGAMCCRHTANLATATDEDPPMPICRALTVDVIDFGDECGSACEMGTTGVHLSAMGSTQEYDLVVIGSGPGGQKAAIAAAKLGKSVAVIERGLMLGGVCVNTGTIPSKTLREAVVYLTGMSQRELYGASYRVKERITPADLLARTQHVIGREIDVVRAQLMRNRIELFVGHARFLDAHTIHVDDPNRAERVTVSGRYVVIATGTKPARPAGVEFDENRVLDSDGILDLKSIPASMVVVGAGVIGIEYASMFAALGTKVTVVEKRANMLEFCDPEIIEALKFHLRDLAVTFRFGEEVTAVDVGSAGTITTLASGKQIPAETVMYSAGRQGQTNHLDLANAGLEADNRGRIFVDDNYQTKVDHIYAVGDVIGFPALAATSMEQGRLAAYHAFGEPCKGMTELQPIGIYSIPEVSYVGSTEVELTKESVPYEVGVSRYRELARGQIAGDSYGMLKMLVSTEDLRLLGVHIFGTNATEMVHIGQSVMGCHGTVEYLVDAVFNYPTFSEAYKVAALDVMNKLRALHQFRS